MITYIPNKLYFCVYFEEIFFGFPKINRVKLQHPPATDSGEKCGINNTDHEI